MAADADQVATAIQALSQSLDEQTHMWSDTLLGRAGVESVTIPEALEDGFGHLAVTLREIGEGLVAALYALAAAVKERQTP